MPAPFRASDLRALAALATDATSGAADIAEGVHAAIWRTLGVPEKEPGRTRGITGGVYRAVRAVTRFVGRALDAVLGRVAPEPRRASGEGSRQRQAFVAALNGVLGDRLASTGNALATPMSLHAGPLAPRDALALSQIPPARGSMPPEAASPEVSGRIVLMVHGLCMNDLQWAARHEGTPVNHAETASSLGWTPVYARYNTGLHISQNGRAFAAQIETLVSEWPVPVEEIAVVAHSMGGLVMRSAVHIARGPASGGEGLRWPGLLSRMVFLGTPHHGAPLERAGNGVDWLLAQRRTTRPLAALGQIRSAGVTDLRHGSVLDADWQGADRFERRGDPRQVLPLPEGVACYAVAATTAPRQRPLAERSLGDGLVPVPSALGHHSDPTRALAFADSAIVYGAHHFKLLSRPEVTEALVRWLAPEARG